MKYIKTLEKYIHTSQDKFDDMILIREFTDKFEIQFEDRLDICTKSNLRFRTFIGYGADKHYDGETIVNNPKIYKTKKKIKYSITIDTDINPAGITSDQDIGRTFTIHFDIKPTNNRHSKIPCFYHHARNIEDILQSFDNYITNTLNIKYLTDEEKKQKKIEKTMIKYNL